MHQFENRSFRHRKVLTLQKLEKKKPFSRSLSLISRIRNLWSRSDSSSRTSTVPTTNIATTPPQSKEECDGNNRTRNARLGKVSSYFMLFKNIKKCK